MSDTIYGYDRYRLSTPAQIRRGSAVVLRRQCQVTDHDTLRESNLDISGATVIQWQVLADLKKTTASILSKSLGSGIALVSSGTTGIIDVTLASAATKNLLPGIYMACLSVTLPSGLYKFAPYHFMILAAPAMAE